MTATRRTVLALHPSSIPTRFSFFFVHSRFLPAFILNTADKTRLTAIDPPPSRLHWMRCMRSCKTLTIRGCSTGQTPYIPSHQLCDRARIFMHLHASRMPTRYYRFFTPEPIESSILRLLPAELRQSNSFSFIPLQWRKDELRFLYPTQAHAVKLAIPPPPFLFPSKIKTNNRQLRC